MQDLEEIYETDSRKPRKEMKVRITTRVDEQVGARKYGESIFDFDWGKDILEAPKPSDFIISEDPQSEQLPYGFGKNTYPYLQADPTDVLTFSEAVSGSKIHYINKWIWQNTLDRYLEHYYRLTRKKEAGQWQTYEVPKVLDTKLIRYFNASESRQKPMPLVVQRTVLMREEGLEEGRSKGKVKIQAAGKAYLNHACRWVFTKDGAPRQPWSLFYDGLLLRVQIQEEKKPETVTLVQDFTLCDYMDHEMLTGISLSIEITAVLLEFFDIPLRERALNAFEDFALPTVVRSQDLFTRISAARNFFQQILMEHNAEYYHWRSSIRDGKISDEEWGGMVSRAVRHVDILKRRRMRLDAPKEETDRAIAHMEKLLSQVVCPVKLLEYVKKPKCGLAAFCNPKHPNIGYFLRELKKKDAGQITEIPRCRRREHLLFRDVHTRVKRAIEEALEEELKN